MEIALGIIAGVVLMALLYIFSMLGYFVLRQKMSGAKYSVEIVVLTFAVLTSIAVKFVIIFLSEDASGNFWQSMANTFKAIYSGIGGLTFEGLSDFEQQTVKSFVQCLYSGSSLYAGVMILSVLTAKISYEIYSGIRLFASFNRKNASGKVDFYIFTAVNEEALTLANSITKQYYEKDNGRKSNIIFTGNAIEAFDSKEELHREIMANGYYYWSYSSKQNDQKGVFEHLKFRPGQDFFIDKPNSRKQESRIHFFALNENLKLSGLECANSSEVFSEIRSLLNNFITVTGGGYKINKNAVIDFYVLSDSETNYEFYQRELEKIVREYVSKFDCLKLWQAYEKVGVIIENSRGKGIEEEVEVKREKLIKFISCYFQLHVVNEAQLAADCMIPARKNSYEEQGKSRIDVAKEYLAESIPNEADEYRVMVLGFGTNGRQSMKKLYGAMAYVNDNLHPSRFIADVYDPHVDDVSGLFGFNHPMFITIDKGSDLQSVTKDEWEQWDAKAGLLFNDKVVKEYTDKASSQLKTYSKEYSKDAKKSQLSILCDKYEENLPQSYEQVKEHFKLPVVAFHKVSSFNHGFLRFLDKNTGNINSTKSAYNAFIVALGDDELNIMMANSIIADVKNERIICGNNEPNKVKTLYVNLRNQDNYGRINYSSVEGNKLGLRVIIYGDKEQMFSYESIVNDYNYMKYDYGYNFIASKLLDHFKEVILGNCALDLSKLKEQRSAIDGADYYRMRKSWLTRSNFKKLSNNEIYYFSPYYEYLGAIEQSVCMKGEYSADKTLLACAVEHERWVRFHIVNGWIFNKNRSDLQKEHNNICPFNMLNVSVIAYDLVNVAISMDNYLRTQEKTNE